ncbi:methylated-DNA--[protein]-cysteine S-methyltransferase [Catellatospora coxensis]|uniref:Methylated-DNA--protein-cysteine methyltransferase n=1 Tax=Catellatospora coxensis TaxID=310354 RepID=A0A8J3KRJ3_9ACTN|nr:methylated-DNA--[protein]-cysteine S-methyltransferase [Catellatospora coxensis]GIG05885.1 methylated-DNA--protein-cysteine methyltransferase [Catellatospora coxensis]
MTARHTRIGTGLGELTAVADGDTLIGLYFPGHWYPPKPEAIGPYVEPAGDPLFTRTAEELAEYLAGRRTTFDVPVALHGDAFQQRVWALLREIPHGRTTTYGTLAAQLGNPALAQRVGQAVGRNPVSVIVPCHRVVGSDGSLTGFAGGLRRKQFLLELEEPAEVKAGRLF